MFSILNGRSVGRKSVVPSANARLSQRPGLSPRNASVPWKTTPPLQQGGLVAFVAQFLGKRLACTYEIAEHRPGQRLVMRTQEGQFLMETTYAWAEESPTTTRMTLRNTGDPAGFSTVAAPVMSMAMRRANRKDLPNLKARLELADS